MEKMELSLGWVLSLPDYWQGEYQKEGGQWVLYPRDSDLTLRITPFHGERNGVPAPPEVMERAFLNALPAGVKEQDSRSFAVEGFKTKMFQGRVREQGKQIQVIFLGYYGSGDLLSCSAWATRKADLQKALEVLETVGRK